MTEKIIEQILNIRNGGKYNMFDINGVQREAYELGYFELVVFISEQRVE